MGRQREQTEIKLFAWLHIDKSLIIVYCLRLRPNPPVVSVAAAAVASAVAVLGTAVLN